MSSNRGTDASVCPWVGFVIPLVHPSRCSWARAMEDCALPVRRVRCHGLGAEVFKVRKVVREELRELLLDGFGIVEQPGNSIDVS